jgi:hypothetical protein
MTLSDAQRSYLLRDHVIGGAIINATMNALFGWLSFRKHGFAPMSGDPSVLNDVIGTGLLLPLIICVIATPLVRKSIEARKLEPLNTDIGTVSAARTMLLWLPTNPVLRGLILSLAALATVTPVLLGVLLAFGVQAMSLGGYVLLKMFYAGLLAAIVSPLVALYVMASATSSVAVIAAVTANQAQITE